MAERSATQQLDTPLFHQTAAELKLPARCPDCDGYGFRWRFGAAEPCGTCIGLGVLAGHAVPGQDRHR